MSLAPRLGGAIVALFLCCAVAAASLVPSPPLALRPVPVVARDVALTLPLPPLAHRVVGSKFDFIADEKTTFASIGSQFGEPPAVLARENGMEVADRLQAGDVIHVDNRHIVPLDGTASIEINVPQRMLFHFKDGGLAGVYPVAVGRPARQWQTPTGAFAVVGMQEDPTWYPPASIRRAEEEAGRRVVDEIGPGPENPLGKYWIGTSFPDVGIHGTNRPGSVYGDRTHGCVRLRPADIKALFGNVARNDRGVIVYLPLMLARTDDARILLESDPDIYGRGTGGIEAVKAFAQSAGIDEEIDWTKAEQVVNDEDGIARDVTAPTQDPDLARADSLGNGE
jgi:L,D-transpeptidase ErfK/SrfK